MIGFIRLVMSLANTYILKTFPRRMLIILSAAGMTVCLAISGTFTHWIKEGATGYNYIPVIFLLLYVVSSMIGLLTIPWTMTAELFPIRIRSMAHSLASSAANLIMFAAIQSYPSMEAGFGGSAGVQWFFAGMSLGAVIFTWVFVPETHLKKLSEIEDYFLGGNTVYLGLKTREQERNKTTINNNEDDRLMAAVGQIVGKEEEEENINSGRRSI